MTLSERLKSMFSYETKVATRAILRQILSIPLRLTFSNAWFPIFSVRFPRSKVLRYANAAAPYDTTFHINTDGAIKYKYRSRITDELNLAARQGFNFFEPASRKSWALLAKNCPTGGIIMDVGAYTGIYSIEACLAAPNSNVIAVEPNLRNIPHLVNNIAINDLDKKIKIIGAALGCENGPGVMRFASEGSSIGSLSSSREGGSNITSIVPLLKLDEIASKLDNPIHLIKIDVEGFESEVLLGALDTLLKHHPRVLVEILEENDLTNMNKFMSKLGYCSGKRLGSEFGDDKNYLFE